MLLSCIALFALAALAPWLVRLFRGWTGLVCASLPLAISVSIGTHVLEIADGGALREGYSWVPSLGLDLSFVLDGFSVVFALLITTIGALILIYAGRYLAGDDRVGRFFSLMIFFMGSMLGLVLTDNLLALFVFWELTSLSSYFLIGFDHERRDARSAALESLLVTGGGGLVLLAGLVLLGIAGGTFEISGLVARSDAIRSHELYQPILWLVLVGAFTKSAQFPFHFWLPNAMTAPTPASAYLHSATMVKAGIFLLARLHAVLGGTPSWTWVVTTVGAATMVIGAYLALRETYLKRLLAYTTVSALGSVVMLLGVGTPLAVKAAMTFLIAHALYKAALFLVAGILDHETGERDTEKLGGLGRKLPATALAAGIAALSMAGVIPLLGFVAKELLFESTWNFSAGRVALTTAAVVAACFVVTVALLVGVKPFVGRQAIVTPKSPHEAHFQLLVGPVLLAVASLVFGLSPGLFAGSFVGPAASAIVGAPVAGTLALWHGWTFPLALDAIALVVGGLIYWRRRAIRSLLTPLDPLMRWGPARWYGIALQGAQTIARVQTRILQSGSLRNYLLTVVLATVGLIAFVVLTRFERSSISVDWSDAQYHEIGLALVILLAAGAAVWSKSRLTAIAAMGVVGFGVGLLFVLFGAPDLAITQFTVETLTVILFVLVFYHLRRFETRSSRAVRVRDAVVATTAGVMMTFLVLVASSTKWYPSISDYYVDQSVSSAHGRNIVNVILVDFRGIDTLGEITVLAVAAIGVYVLLRLRLGGEGEGGGR